MQKSETNKVPFRRLFGWAMSRVRERGLIQGIKVATELIVDRFFDWKHGIETRRWVGTAALETKSENKSRAVQYQASKGRPFLKLLKRLKLPENSVFVDLGSGKGRVLLLASQCDFKRVVGIEFCASLCAQARENIDIFRKHTPRAAEIEVIESDVTRVSFNGDENVFYLYNPFDAVVLGQVIENIGRSLKDRPRQVWLVYNTPVLHEVIERAKLFGTRQVFNIGGSEFSVYTNIAPSRSKSMNCLWTVMAMTNSFAKAVAFI